MTQKDLFIFDDLPFQSVELIELTDGEILWVRHFYEPAKCEQLYKELHSQIPWQQDQIRIAGKPQTIPRLQAWFGDKGLDYTYSGLTMTPNPWPALLKQIKQDIEQYSDSHFNSMLANLYRNENDSVGWHADNEKELGTNPVIASLSLGGSRDFLLKHNQHPDKKLSITLNDGDLLIMKGPIQHFWTHAIPKRTQPCEPRINLTFRKIITRNTVN